MLTGGLSYDEAGRWRYVLPIIAFGSDTVGFVKDGVRIVRKDGSVVDRSNGRISLEKSERGERAFTPVAGLLTAYLLTAGRGQSLRNPATTRWSW